ncbi:hypothetical protein EV384_4780 [Micromonospora kangleipakensis]|uniref:Uncharacterized protein n=1 Tax=Micromonospora kangleipakensis TaxID=1077942 RepID=A0A4Q8BE03_9ACTN|nr:hypothetical protein EV384_4780 [Micromonospora kangleipakensis]
MGTGFGRPWMGARSRASTGRIAATADRWPRAAAGTAVRTAVATNCRAGDMRHTIGPSGGNANDIAAAT